MACWSCMCRRFASFGPPWTTWPVTIGGTPGQRSNARSSTVAFEYTRAATAMPPASSLRCFTGSLRVPSARPHCSRCGCTTGSACRSRGSSMPLCTGVFARMCSSAQPGASSLAGRSLDLCPRTRNEIDARDEHRQQQQEPRIRQHCQSAAAFEWKSEFVRKETDEHVRAENAISRYACPLAQEVVDEQSHGEPEQSEVVGRRGWCDQQDQ